MCIEFTAENQEIRVKRSFRLEESLITQKESFSSTGYLVKKEVFWDGWIKAEDSHKWTNGQWKRVEILATKFNQGGNQYDVPSGEVIRAIGLDRGKDFVIKVLTRESKGKELRVQKRFALTKPRRLIQNI